MNDFEAKFLPYLFTILFGFVLLNFIMNLCLYSFSRIKNIKLLSAYWLSLLLSFAMQGLLQKSQLAMVFGYSLSIFPIIIMAQIIFDTMSKKPPVKHYLLLWLLAVVVTPVLHHFDLGFTLVSMPISLALGFIPLHTAYHILHHERHAASVLQKFLAGTMVLTFLHCLNYSFFRMVPGTELWGYGIALGLYQIYSVSIFALVLEDYSRKEKLRLEKIVSDRTAELEKALNVKETLFRMVLHDIANPIQSQLWLIQFLEEKRMPKFDVLKKLKDMTNLVKSVVEQVRTIEGINSGKLQVAKTPVHLDKCLLDINDIFTHQLEKKNITLRVKNELPEGTMFYADQNIFTSSVLSNLVSNGIKFSQANSELIIHAYEKEHKVVIELEDQGIGMPEELTFLIFDPKMKSTRAGTHGEKGTGFGMIQVKSYVEHFGGSIDVESRPMEAFPTNHGTKITLTMDKMSASLQ